MTIQEVKTKIESNTGLIGNFISSSIDITNGDYTRLNLEYLVTVNPQETGTVSFLANGISGDYTIDKSYDSLIDGLKRVDMESDSKDYLNSLTGSTISTWDEYLAGSDNPDLGYAKVYITSASIDVPHAWLLTRTGSNVTHSSTTWDQFPMDEY